MVVANYLVSESFVLVAIPVGQVTVPVNLQQHKYSSLFCNFLSLYDEKSVIPLKVRALRMGFQAVDDIIFTEDGEPA